MPYWRINDSIGSSFLALWMIGPTFNRDVSTEGCFELLMRHRLQFVVGPNGPLSRIDDDSIFFNRNGCAKAGVNVTVANNAEVHVVPMRTVDIDEGEKKFLGTSDIVAKGKREVKGKRGKRLTKGEIANVPEKGRPYR